MDILEDLQKKKKLLRLSRVLELWRRTLKKPMLNASLPYTTGEKTTRASSCLWNLASMVMGTKMVLWSLWTRNNFNRTLSWIKNSSQVARRTTKYLPWTVLSGSREVLEYSGLSWYYLEKYQANWSVLEKYGFHLVNRLLEYCNRVLNLSCCCFLFWMGHGSPHLPSYNLSSVSLLPASLLPNN